MEKDGEGKEAAESQVESGQDPQGTFPAAGRDTDRSEGERGGVRIRQRIKVR